MSVSHSTAWSRRSVLRRTVLALVVPAVVAAIGAPTAHAVASAPPTPREPVETGYAPVNGQEIYFEIHGSGGVPLIVLHGGFGTIANDFGAILPVLAEHRQVIGIELQGHGHTADIDRPLTFEALADDLAAVIAHLGVERADLFGFSLGGGVALQTAIRHPEVVGHIVVASAPFRRDGWYPEVLVGMEQMNAPGAAEFMATLPMHDAYVQVAPNPDDWPALVSKLGELLATDYDWSEQLPTIAAPALLVVGDSDSVQPAHAVEMFQLLGGGVPGDFGALPTSALAVLPQTGHQGVLSRVELLAAAIVPFLDAPLPER